MNSMSRRRFVKVVAGSGVAILASRYFSFVPATLAADISSDFNMYSDPDGCLTLYPNSKQSPSCDNTMLFTAEKLVIIGPTRNNEIAWFKNHIMSCLTNNGIIRHPNLRNVTSYDDILGACAFLKKYNYISEARKIWDYLESHGWYNGDNFIGRFPHFVPFVRYCANIELDILGVAAISSSFMNNIRDSKNDTSGRCMNFLMAAVLPQPNVFNTLGQVIRNPLGEIFPPPVNPIKIPLNFKVPLNLDAGYLDPVAFKLKVPQLHVPIPKLPLPIPKLPLPIPKLPLPIPKLPLPIPKLPLPVPEAPVPLPKLPLPIPDTPVPLPKLPLPNLAPPIPIPDLLRYPSKIVENLVSGVPLQPLPVSGSQSRVNWSALERSRVFNKNMLNPTSFFAVIVPAEHGSAIPSRFSGSRRTHLSRSIQGGPCAGSGRWSGI